jgi:hypothetical protein
VHDVLLIATMLDDQGLLPPSVTLAEFTDVDRIYNYHWFWCPVFPRFVEPFDSIDEHVIFSDLNGFDSRALRGGGSPMRSGAQPGLQIAKRAVSFEYFLDQQRKLNDLRSWSLLIKTQASQLMTLCVDFLRQHPAIRVPREVFQVIRLTGIEAELVAQARQMKEFVPAWDRICEKYQDDRALKELLAHRASTKNLVWQGIRTVKCLVDAPLPRSFGVLLHTLMQFQEIAQELDLGKTLLCRILGQFPGEVIFMTCVVFNGTVAREGGFMSYTENLAWCTIVACILEMLKDNLSLLHQVVSVTEDLERAVNGKRGKG